MQVRIFANRLGGESIGDLALNNHFLRCGPALTTPTKWVCAMNLTFEQANLDLAPVFAERFKTAGDEKSVRERLAAGYTNHGRLLSPSNKRVQQERETIKTDHFSLFSLSIFARTREIVSMQSSYKVLREGLVALFFKCTFLQAGQ